MSNEEDNYKIIYFTNFGTFKMTGYEQNKKTKKKNKKEKKNQTRRLVYFTMGNIICGDQWSNQFELS